jgi:hypothetical protein
MAIIYQPVVHADSGPYRGAALVGTHSAVIGWTFDDLALRDNLLGFAIRRTAFDPGSSSHKFRDRIVFSGG